MPIVANEGKAIKAIKAIILHARPRLIPLSLPGIGRRIVAGAPVAIIRPRGRDVCPVEAELKVSWAFT